MKRKLSKDRIKNTFEEYKRNSKLRLDELAKDLKISRTMLRKYFKEEFGEKYTEITKERSKTSKKVSDEKIRQAFEKYRKGKRTIELAQELGIKRVTLQYRMKKIMDKKYMELAKRRSSKDAGITKQKVSCKKIKKAFEKYEKNKISLSKLAKNLGIDQSSLIERFQKIFGEKYKRIAKSKKEKITKEMCIKAFKRYQNTSVSLAQLADEFGIGISSLKERFLILFGNEYKKIAAEKEKLNNLMMRGKIFENLVFEYFKLLGKEVKDVRNETVFNGTQKRTDFLIGDAFVEVKCNYISLFGFTWIKGYNDIISDYLGKEINESNKKTKSGIIVSLAGFSKDVRIQAKKDGIELVDYKKLKEVFRKNNRSDLILILKS